MLQLGAQTIVVRAVSPHTPGYQADVSQLAQIVANSGQAEEVIVLLGVSGEAGAKMHWAASSNARGHRVVVGYQAYCDWLSARLGRLAKMPYTSPVRQLGEYFAQVNSRTPDIAPEAKAYSRQASYIETSFELGDKGEAVVAALIQAVAPPLSVVSVADDRNYQLRDIDMLLVGPERNPQLALNLEVKTEDKETENLTLEAVGNLGKGSLGWFWYSQADVLISVMATTGDVLVCGLKQVRNWLTDNPDTIPVRKGTVPGQPYKSLIYIPKLTWLLDTFVESFHLQLTEWAPNQRMLPLSGQPQISPAHDHAKIAPKLALQ